MGEYYFTDGGPFDVGLTLADFAASHVLQENTCGLPCRPTSYAQTACRKR